VNTLRELGPDAPTLCTGWNLLEYVIHHEDCRRAAGFAPREVSEDLQRWVLKRLRPFARLTMRKAKLSLILQPPGEQPIRIDKGDSAYAVIVEGAPVELALFASGRQTSAVVDYSGDPSAVQKVTAAGFGI